MKNDSHAPPPTLFRSWLEQLFHPLRNLTRRLEGSSTKADDAGEKRVQSSFLTARVEGDWNFLKYR